MSTRKYDTTVARIAGNIASSFVARQFMGSANRFLHPSAIDEVASEAVALARAIVAEVKRTEPAPEPSA